MGLKRVLGLDSYQTARSWLHKIRRAMVRPGRSPLNGNVEVDETLIGGKEQGGKRGRGASKKAVVVIAVEVHEPKGLPKGVRLTKKETKPYEQRIERSDRLPKWNIIIEPLSG